MSPLQQMTRAVPIVFVGVVDPVGAGFVASLASPGGNTTGFTVYEYGTSGSGWSCSRRLRRAFSGQRSCAILRQFPGAASSAQSSPWRRR
jgi:hypothetical protein